ncbi:AMP-binding protein [Domibacillus enclensis]|uniref:Acyl-CoA synthetase (AMP-forming)/AMP-acid ligase II n=1 Tax=Domibacillus enclensis TaxID=1017273 RepID=A0A1N6SDI4_9BACI|nr:AMP-binding protein [Domibacillus enclensis]OXS79293.1 phosphatase [Domibacillus enclensis]SIQ39110.1 Acyl-CoA synthetase (AMP-forming)/AMP-acid ligase II [Domibacillus enclensis]
MNFWNVRSSAAPAVVTEEHTYTYLELSEAIQERKKNYHSDEKQFVLILCESRYDVMVAYLAALQAGHAVMLLNHDLNEDLLKEIIHNYKPCWMYGEGPFPGYDQQDGLLWKRESQIQAAVHPNLALLLSTSGTTGSRKFVRLSYQNIQSNAESIAEYLQIDSSERGVANLPLSYSYGLSIVNSHLQAGATVLLTNESIISKSFWAFFQEQRATSFAGVPFTYQMLQRIGFFKMELPYLRQFTQAGGRLDERLVKQFGDYAIKHKKRFYVMYGQTEASPRMAYIPAEKVIEKAGTIGIPIPGGELAIDRETNELLYKGPNVMMGYAECIEDLAKGDELNGVLYTGDTAEKDAGGFYTITGRTKRFVKLFGLRINLDEVEKRLEQEIHLPVACSGTDDKMIIVIETELEKVNNMVKHYIEDTYKLHKSAYRIHTVDSIPRMSNGKTDYMAIKDGFQ